MAMVPLPPALRESGRKGSMRGVPRSRNSTRSSAECNSTVYGSVLSKTLLFGLLLQVILAVVLLHSLTEKDAAVHLFPEPVIDAVASSASFLTPHHPLQGLIRSYTHGNHDPTQQRISVTFSLVPKEFPSLRLVVSQFLNYMDNDPYETFEAIHLCIPDRPLRFKDHFPTTAELQKNFSDPRIIIHRLPDYGPMTRYLGPLAYEKHPESAIVLFDMDSVDLTYDLTYPTVEDATRDIVHLVYASYVLDTTAVWCNQGENFRMNEFHQVRPEWNLFEEVPAQNNFTWNHVHFCRGVGGMLFKPKHFNDFWYNQSDYHESCFWDDDRWVSYQMERQGFPLKVIHTPIPKNKHKKVVESPPAAAATTAEGAETHGRRLGTLTHINGEMQSDQNCAAAWLTKHPQVYPSARVKSGTPWQIKQPMPVEEMLNSTIEAFGKDANMTLKALRRLYRIHMLGESGTDDSPVLEKTSIQQFLTGQKPTTHESNEAPAVDGKTDPEEHTSLRSPVSAKATG